MQIEFKGILSGSSADLNSLMTEFLVINHRTGFYMIGTAVMKVLMKENMKENMKA